MTILFLILALIGWVSAIFCFAMLIIAVVTISAQDMKHADELTNLKKSYENAILMRSRNKNN